MRTWLKQRQYNTSTTEQLWEAMSSAVGRNVGAWMHGWSTEKGFPLVRVTLGGITDRDVSVSQVRPHALLKQASQQSGCAAEATRRAVPS